MSLEFDIAGLRAPCEPGDTMGVVQLIARAKMAADQLEELTTQRDELLAALKEIAKGDTGEGGCYYTNRHGIYTARAAVNKYERDHA